jgi:hypothetical protein
LLSQAEAVVVVLLSVSAEAAQVVCGQVFLPQAVEVHLNQQPFLQKIVITL